MGKIKCLQNNAANQMESPLKKIKVESEMSSTCFECEESTSKYCEQCNAFLCDACFTKIHNTSKVLRTHTCRKKSMNLQAIGFCGTHPNQVTTFICTQCDLDICSKCEITHVAHAKVSIQSAVSKENEKYFS